MKVKVHFPGHVAHGKICEAYRWKDSKCHPHPMEGWALTVDGCDYVLPLSVCREIRELVEPQMPKLAQLLVRQLS